MESLTQKGEKMENSKRKDVICFSLDKRQKLQIKKLAEQEKRSISQIIQLIVEDYLKNLAA